MKQRSPPIFSQGLKRRGMFCKVRHADTFRRWTLWACLKKVLIGSVFLTMRCVSFAKNSQLILMHSIV